MTMSSELKKGDTVAQLLNEWGFAQLPDVLPPRRLALIDEEAKSIYPRSERYIHDRFDVEDGVVTSSATYRSAVGGPALCALWASRAFVELLSSAAGSALTPTRCSYLFYERDDHIGLHLDVNDCELTVTFGLWGAQPVVIYPEFRSLSTDDLVELAQRTAGRPEGGEEVPLRPRSVLLNYGTRTPHRRPPAPGLTCVAAMCYRVGNQDQDHHRRGGTPAAQAVLNHLHLKVADPVAACEFYTRALGMVFAYTCEQEINLQSADGRSMLVLSPATGSPGDRDSGSMDHFGFALRSGDEVRRATDACISLGAQLIEAGDRDGTAYAFLRVPDGHVVELVALRPPMQEFLP